MNLKEKSIFKIFILTILLTGFWISSIAPGCTQTEEPENELAGIELGFSTDQVEKILGIPPVITDLGGENDTESQLVWEYVDKGIKVLFKNNRVEVIIIEDPCTIPTPRGLKIGDSWKKSLNVYRYCSAYVQNTGNEIGIIFTLQGGIKLAIAVPGDKEEIYRISLWKEEVNSDE